MSDYVLDPSYNSLFPRFTALADRKLQVRSRSHLRLAACRINCWKRPATPLAVFSISRGKCIHQNPLTHSSGVNVDGFFTPVRSFPENRLFFLKYFVIGHRLHPFVMNSEAISTRQQFPQHNHTSVILPPGINREFPK